jgi:ribosomal protein S18 acetylase RimI-like enzyme
MKGSAGSSTCTPVSTTEGQLIGSYILRELPDSEFEPLLREHHPRVFSGRFDFALEQALSATEKSAMAALRDRLGTPYRLNLAVYREEEFVGWSFGLQESAEKFYMINAGVVPEHQNRGIYSALLPHVLERVKEQGFQIAYSRHAATNNRILVPKLKAGFLITAFELSDRFGTLVHLSYLFNPLRRKVLDVRSGETVPDAEVRKHLRLE